MDFPIDLTSMFDEPEIQVHTERFIIETFNEH